MDQLNILQEEVEALQSLLQKKQEELNRLKSDVSFNQSTDNNLHKPSSNSTDEGCPKTVRSDLYWEQTVNNLPDEIYNDSNNVYQCNIKCHGPGFTTQDVNDSKEMTRGSDGTNTHIGALPKWAIERYSRQILLPDVGVRGQAKLCGGRVLIVGAGGLGCPAGVYLAGAGVGEIGIVDYDTVDVTNIHRQFLHAETDQALSKAESAANSLRSINSRIKVTPYNVQLNSQNAVQIASQYDIVLDCTDNVPTRYLLNDLCVLTKIPLISGSALKMEGQLTVYGYRAKDTSGEKEEYIGPCYRCVFPSPPPAEAVGSCSANGVAGPVPGAIGSLQALEAIKFLVGQPHSKLLVERMLLFDGEDMTFRTVKLRPRNPQCTICSETPTVSQLIDYEIFCKAQAKEKLGVFSNETIQDNRRMTNFVRDWCLRINIANVRSMIKDSHLKSELRKREKEKRMTGQSYYGFRTKPKWVQDVPKSERKLGPPCNCKGTLKKCSNFTENLRQDIFLHFWNDLDWKLKRNYLRSLVDSVPVKRRRVKLKGLVSRKGESKAYHLLCGGEKVPVCRVMFLNTLGVKEATVRCWLLGEDRPKSTKKPIKAINVDAYIDSLPRLPPKCQYCLNSGSKLQYINLENIKNLFQLYNMYSQDMKLKNCVPASRKTFSKVIHVKNIRIFKAKNEEVCDVVKEHNTLPSLSYCEQNFNNLFSHPQDLDLQILSPEHRISATDLANQLTSKQRHLLIDVRNEAEFSMCRIDGSVNYPIDTFAESIEKVLGEIRKANMVTFVCRRGNDSQLAAQSVLEAIEREHSGKVNDLRGGLHAWAARVDTTFPVY